MTQTAQGMANASNSEAFDVDRALALMQQLSLKKARALLFYLMGTPGQFHRSEKIIDLFWQSADPVKAAASYRQAVSKLRKALTEASQCRLETRPGEIVFLPPSGWSLEHDLVAALPDDAARRLRLRPFLALYDGLQGLSPTFDSWLAISQASAMSTLRSAIDARLAQDGETPERQSIAEFALELDPTNERAVRALMELHWQAQSPTRAIELYNTLYAYLDENFDQEPEAETVSLLAAIKMHPGGSERYDANAAHTRVSLAIDSADTEHLDPADASLLNILLADFRMRLSRFREWSVVSPESGMADPYVRITLRLFVRGNSQELLVEVTRSSDGGLVWSEFVPAPTEAWEGKLRPLLMNIANALSVVVADRSPVNAGAAVYDRWLKSQALLDAWSPETEGNALDMLRDITSEAPGFGPAHAELAGALNVRHILRPGTEQTEDVKQTALHHALEAVSVDPLDTRAHRVLAWCYCHKAEFGLADFHFEQALRLNPANPLTLASCALGFAFADNLPRTRDLVAETRSHAAVMERYHLVYLAAADYLCGQFERTAEQCAQSRGLMATVGGWHACALAKLGDVGAARARYLAFIDEVSADWMGAGPPSERAIREWFLSVFPLKSSAARRDLRATLEAVAHR